MCVCVFDADYKYWVPVVLTLAIYSLFQDAEGVCDTLDYCRNSLIQLLLSFKTASAENVCDTD